MDIRLNDRIRFFSELELEHLLSGDDKAGEVELEQAFVEFNLNDDLTQTAAPKSATLFAVHADLRSPVATSSEFGVRAFFAQWNLNSMEAELIGRDVQRGWYDEPSCKYSFINGEAIGFFTRYSSFDNNAGNTINTANKQTSFGVNYWPHENVALKADYQIDDRADETKDDNRINLGVGVQF